MLFPEQVKDAESMHSLIKLVREVGLRELFLGGSKLVASLDLAVWISFHDSGKAIARYKRRGDGSWHRVEEPPGDDLDS